MNALPKPALRIVGQIELPPPQTVLEILEVRLKFALHPSNTIERPRFTAMLKAQGLTPGQYMHIAQQAALDIRRFIRDEDRESQEYKAKTLADVKSRTYFSKVLVVVREMYAADIASKIDFWDVCRLVVDEVLLHR